MTKLARDPRFFTAGHEPRGGISRSGPWALYLSGDKVGRVSRPACKDGCFRHVSHDPSRTAREWEGAAGRIVPLAGPDCEIPPGNLRFLPNYPKLPAGPPGIRIGGRIGKGWKAGFPTEGRLQASG